MKLIVITSASFFPKEIQAIHQLFNAGLLTLHLRKPNSSVEELASFIKNIDPVYKERIVLHDHFQELSFLGLRRVHLNSRNKITPKTVDLKSISCSCHSLEEIKRNKDYDYVFLSPIFDSISKIGYKQAFTESQLLEAKRVGYIYHKVIALGGISIQTIPLAAHYGFGGVAVLGALWSDFEKDSNIHSLIARFNELQKICKQQ